MNISGRSIVFQLLIDEKEEIEKHKWCESEKAHHDIGKDMAILDWCHHHRHLWMKEKIRKLKNSTTSESDI